MNVKLALAITRSSRVRKTARKEPQGRKRKMKINGVDIEDTFAEAFGMTAARAVITAASALWAMTAARAVTGYATSVIGCDAEAGIERVLDGAQTPDGRDGVSVLFFSFGREKLQQAVANRVGQCVMTCASTACYNGLPRDEKNGAGEKTIAVGGQLRYFGDGHQIAKVLDGRRYWRIPCMDGEFTCEDAFGTTQAVAGGNFLILAQSQAAGLSAAEAAVEAIADVPDVMLPFPGGVVRSGSKVGSKYKKLRASTNDAYCPTLRGSCETALPAGVNAVYEIVIDGLSVGAVEQATRVGVVAACRDGVVRISAGNYGGDLGPHHIRLHDVLDGA